MTIPKYRFKNPYFNLYQEANNWTTSRGATSPSSPQLNTNRSTIIPPPKVSGMDTGNIAFINKTNRKFQELHTTIHDLKDKDKIKFPNLHLPSFDKDSRATKAALGLVGAGTIAGVGTALYNHLTGDNANVMNNSIVGGAGGAIGGALLPEISTGLTHLTPAVVPALWAAGAGAIVAGMWFHPFIALGITSSLGSCAYLINKKENVDEAKQLSNFIEKSYAKAIQLRYNELQTIKDENRKAFDEANSKCELNIPAFNHLTVNYNCALEAYIGYCTSMFVGLLTVYLQSVNAKGVNLKHITRIEQVLAIQEDTALNIMLNQCYNKIIKTINFIFKGFPEVVSKYNVFIDNSITTLIQKLDRFQPKQINNSNINTNYNSQNLNKFHKPNDHRQFKGNYANK